ncbi:putative PDZ domain, Rubredoxin-like domain, PDZ superfamily [Helianthus annuus]|uniref:Putative rubredoxin family protein n=1 Tax=Helianthus annuus TaxID=4232 RepID=A0A251UX02_HELAN|nr:uncharacterized protein LOC110936276 [Helianthus annuus]KAJ0547064.1 putative PDZ domain, Rubredoxin-like domain, PDZ superfamily [Helianthus annuus]KAJ0719309.1 putative PDZ domain, Rubredoxin-like domain, PDZ superfamily [Helianthus annuus]KAJ0765016.1 putative PDZ domain, Rubredoxin-like domain, PDZ superfamily [Helianthus annuus]
MSTTTAGAAPATAFSTRNSYPLSSPPPQKTIFQGVSIQDAKRSLSVSFNKTTDKTSAISKRNRGLEINARKTAGASKQIEVEVDKPLGLTLGPKPGSGGGVVITGVDGGGNAAKAGLKVGDQVIYTSSFFGDELWPADRLGFTKTAIQAVPDSVYFVVSRGVDVDVKRLPKRPAPPRFGRKLTDAQKERATHICLDCGYIYTLSKPFDDQPDGYLCPQCRAPKKRFTRYDPATGKPIGGTLPPIGVIIGLVAGLAGVGALLVYGLQ